MATSKSTAMKEEAVEDLWEAEVLALLQELEVVRFDSQPLRQSPA